MPTDQEKKDAKKRQEENDAQQNAQTAAQQNEPKNVEPDLSGIKNKTEEGTDSSNSGKVALQVRKQIKPSNHQVNNNYVKTALEMMDIGRQIGEDLKVYFANRAIEKSNAAVEKEQSARENIATSLTDAEENVEAVSKEIENALASESLQESDIEALKEKIATNHEAFNTIKTQAKEVSFSEANSDKHQETMQRITDKYEALSKSVASAQEQKVKQSEERMKDIIPKMRKLKNQRIELQQMIKAFEEGKFDKPFSQIQSKIKEIKSEIATFENEVNNKLSSVHQKQILDALSDDKQAIDQMPREVGSLSPVLLTIPNNTPTLESVKSHVKEDIPKASESETVEPKQEEITIAEKQEEQTTTGPSGP